MATAAVNNIKSKNQKQMSTNQIAEKDKSECRFTPLGESMEIALSFSIVKNNFCSPTKSGVPPSTQDVTAFLMTCRSQQLNPFLGDAWLTGYDTKDGAKFSVLVSQRVLLKRAELHPQFDGLESGITVEDAEGNIKDLASEIIPKNFTLIGGWCRVFRSDRSRPVYKQIAIEGYRKQTHFWTDNPAGMITKCAESDALRFAFPSANGALRTAEDKSIIDIGEVTNQVRMEAPRPATALPVTQSDQAMPAASPCDELADIVTGAGFGFDDLQKWGVETGNLPEGMTLGSFSDIHAATAKRLIRAKSGLLQGLAQLKGGAQ
jgi:phage recombination protein Bet